VRAGHVRADYLSVYLICIRAASLSVYWHPAVGDRVCMYVCMERGGMASRCVNVCTERGGMYVSSERGGMAAWRAYKCVKQVEFLANGSHVGSDKWVMAPLAELLNHQPFSGHIQWQDNDVSSGVFQIISDRHYLAGEQVLRCSYALLYS
jgi:hypothetical protein